MSESIYEEVFKIVETELLGLYVMTRGTAEKFSVGKILGIMHSAIGAHTKFNCYDKKGKHDLNYKGCKECRYIDLLKSDIMSPLLDS